MSPLPGDSRPSEGISLAQNTIGDPVRKYQNRARALDRLGGQSQQSTSDCAGQDTEQSTPIQGKNQDG